MFEFIEASFDAISLFVELGIVFALHGAVAFGWYDDSGSHGLDMRHDGVGIVALVGQHGVGLARAQQFDGLGAIIGLAAGETKIDGDAGLVGEQMNLGCQASSGTPQSLVVAPFLRPVAAC